MKIKIGADELIYHLRKNDKCKDIDDMVENIRNDWGKGSKSYKQSGWLKENDNFTQINGVYQSFLVK